MSAHQSGLSYDSQAWCHAAGTANTVESRVTLLQRLDQLEIPALGTLLKCDSPRQDGILLLMQWWPSLSKVEDQLLMLRVFHKLPLSAKVLLETKLPELLAPVVSDAPQRTTVKAKQLLTRWKRILSSAQRYLVTALVDLLVTGNAANAPLLYLTS